jgi:hypothetical protein
MPLAAKKSSPGRKAGETGAHNHARRACGTVEVPVVGTSDYAILQSLPEQGTLSSLRRFGYCSWRAARLRK